MIEIELVNRIYKEAFKKSDYKFALIPHCLRDFRPECKSVSGDYESICKGCTKDCFVHLGGKLLKKYDIHPFISVSLDLDKVFEELHQAKERGAEFIRFKDEVFPIYQPWIKEFLKRYPKEINLPFFC